MTLETVLINTLYNDLGMMVHGRLLILVEAQSSWSINILIRIILYFAGEWKKYIQDTKQSVYSSMKISIPRPEFYVIYTGGDKKVTCIDIAIKMLANHESEAKIQEYTGLSSSDLQDIKDGKTVLA